MENLIQPFSVFILIFMRVSAFFVTLPIFSYRTIPTTFRIGFSAFLAFLIFFTIDVPPLEINGEYLLLILKEAMVGLLIGFVAYMILSVIQIAGGFIDFQMGFAIANVIDPQTGAQSPLIGQYLYIFALLFLMSVNGHHLMINGVFQSYQLIPVQEWIVPYGNENLMMYVAKAFAAMFSSAFQMAIPIVASLFLVDVALGIIARTVPQLNVFVVGFPIKIAVSFIILFLIIGLLFAVVQNLFEDMLIVMRNMMELMGGTG